jgi:hypothetical protein
MNRIRQQMRRNADRLEQVSDSWILFKRWVFCAIGVFAVAAPIFWVYFRDREWSTGMTVSCILGAGFFALGLFGSRRMINEADI